MKTKATKKDNFSYDTLIFNIIGYLATGIFTIFCLIPFMLIISSSFTSEMYVIRNGFTLIPKDFTLDAYKTIFTTTKSVVNAYKISIIVLIVKTTVGVFITSMTAYVLFRKDFKYRNIIAFLIFFTTMFGGGLVPTYIINTQYYGFEDRLYALILPGMLVPFNIILMRNFLNSIPMAIIESAKIDGSGDFRTFITLVLPLSTAGLATIGLFIALESWNSWVEAMLYINDTTKFPLQYLLYQIISQARFENELAAKSGIPAQEVPKETLKMAMAVITIGPIIFVYPFAQKYFIKGITIGAVKG